MVKVAMAPQLLSTCSPGRRRVVGVLTRKQTREYRSLRALAGLLNDQGWKPGTFCQCHRLAKSRSSHWQSYYAAWRQRFLLTASLRCNQSSEPVWHRCRARDALTASKESRIQGLPFACSGRRGRCETADGAGRAKTARASSAAERRRCETSSTVCTAAAGASSTARRRRCDRLASRGARRRLARRLPELRPADRRAAPRDDSWEMVSRRAVDRGRPPAGTARHGGLSLAG